MSDAGTAAAYVHGWRPATPCSSAPRPGVGDDLALDGNDEEGAYRSAAAYAAAAGCVLPAADPAERTRTEQLISQLTLAVAELAAAHTAAAPTPLHHD